MVSIQNYSGNFQNVAFTAQMREKTNSSNSPKSHAGLKTGAVWSVVRTSVSLGMLGISSWATSKVQHSANNSFQRLNSQKVQDLLKHATKLQSFSKSIWIGLPINIAIALGCGALVDKLNNGNRAKFAEELAAKGEKAILEENDKARKTKAGNIYCKSDEGKKRGSLLGVAGVVVPSLFILAFARAKGAKVTKVDGEILIDKLVNYAIGGFSLGAIADSFSNKTAAKNADKLASKATVSQDVQLESNETEEG